MHTRRAAAPVLAAALLLGMAACAEEEPVTDSATEVADESEAGPAEEGVEAPEPEDIDEGVVEGPADQPEGFDESESPGNS
jgi:hypothetical protein